MSQQSLFCMPCILSDLKIWWIDFDKWNNFISVSINLLLLVIPLEFQHLCVPFDYRGDTLKKKTLNANFPLTNLTLPEALLRKEWIVQSAPWSQASPSTLTLQDGIQGLAFLTTIRADGGRKKRVLFTVVFTLLLFAYSHQFHLSWKRPQKNKSFA